MATNTYDIWVVDETGQRVRRTVVEQADDTIVIAAENARTMRGQIANALAANAAYLALVGPSNAQNVAHLRLLTRELSAIIRLTLDLLDTTDDT